MATIKSYTSKGVLFEIGDPVNFPHNWKGKITGFEIHPVSGEMMIHADNDGSILTSEVSNFTKVQKDPSDE